MSDFLTRLRRSEDVIKRLAASLRGARLYAPAHPRLVAHHAALVDAIKELHAWVPTILLGFVGGEIIVDELPLQRAREQFADLAQRLEALGINRITVHRGVTADEIGQFVHAVATAPVPERREQPDDDTIEVASADFITLPHLTAGRIEADPDAGSWGSSASLASARRVYTSAVGAAKVVWESARLDGQPELPAAREMVENLADAVSLNRPALVGLTAMQKFDNYTFTHMVNVSILTMGQARALGFDGRPLRDLGLAGLMHDIGKVRTPTEILTKPEKLTDQEFAIMKRHTSDGALILRRTADMPPVAPIIAFEHHLRLDGTGYPDGVRRTTLNVGTMLCAIADVYDAMRSQRKYQQAFPSQRILEVMRRNDGRQFDQHLVRRFVQLVGIYPPGCLVRLTSGEIAVVTRVHAPDPFHPAVRVLLGPDGERLPEPRDLNLWEPIDAESRQVSVAAPVDPAECGLAAVAAG
jgi:putative nucleotidyltransferase with HDIG domain